MMTESINDQHTSIHIMDNPPLPLVTPEVLKAARTKTHAKVLRYDLMSVDFLSNTSSNLFNPKTLQSPPKICDSALDLVGRTPMVRLTRLAKKFGLKCDLIAKCEFLSIGGSVKDRIGKRMIEEAEKQGHLDPGDCLIEATSGNTGIGMCLAAALKGYRMLITLPEKMSQEKLNTMAALGAEIIRTPTGAPWHSLDSHIGLAVQIQQTIPKCHFLDQYSNPDNPRAHYLDTAEEILWQCDNEIDMLVMTVGTGGTVTGVAQKIKERVPECKIVAVDPKGSILAEPEELNDDGRGKSYLVEGIGYDFIPSTLHRQLVDEWVKTDDNESFRLARECIRLEGLLVGGSSGSAIAGALKSAQNLNAHQRCVVVLPDSARNYMTKFISDDWMVDNGFYPPRTPTVLYGSHKVCHLPLSTPLTMPSTTTLQAAIHMMVAHTLHQIFVVDDERVVGLLTQTSISSALLSGRWILGDSIKGVMDTKFRTARMDTSLADIARMLLLHPCVAIFNDENKLVGAVTNDDLFKKLEES